MVSNILPSTPYLLFNRQQWATLRRSEPQPLSEDEINKLKGINDKLSIQEISEIYLPLSRLINFYINSNLRRQLVLDQFLNGASTKSPYIIGIAGSVAVGKSTTARVLQALLSRSPKNRKVDLITTDGFLYPNKILQERGIMKKKGFPQSYDIVALLNFVADIKAGKPCVKAPLYSHLVYDVLPHETYRVEQPDNLILEGLNVLQSAIDYPHLTQRMFVSDFVDFSIYVDAEEALLRKWYQERFLTLRQSAFADPNSYFHHYAQLPEEQVIDIAQTIWQDINSVNLNENILPTKERANLILSKGENHLIKSVQLRR